MFYKKGVFKKIAKHLCRSIFLNKVASLCNFIKKYFSTGVFLWNLRNLNEPFATERLQATTSKTIIFRNFQENTRTFVFFVLHMWTVATLDVS